MKDKRIYFHEEGMITSRLFKDYSEKRVNQSRYYIIIIIIITAKLEKGRKADFTGFKSRQRGLYHATPSRR